MNEPKAIPQKTPYPVSVLVVCFFFLLSVVPTVVSLGPIFFVKSLTAKLVVLGLFPVVFFLVFTHLAALLSMPFQKAIVPGKFPRELNHYVYGPRRLYGLCWGAIFYFTPIYYAVMSIPRLRSWFFWLFGYRSNNKINIAPDAWLRDLPVLDLEEGVYIANKSTIGTNICLSDNTVIVDKIHLGKKTTVGHLVMLAPGCDLGDNVEIGVGCAIGIRVKIGAGSRIGPTTTVNHGARIGANVDVGTMSYIGLKATIADGIKIPGGANIPEGALIQKQEEVASYVSSETRILTAHSTHLSSIYASRLTTEAFVTSVESAEKT